MISLGYIFSRILRKSRGSAIRDSVVHPTSKVESGSTIVRTNFDRHSFCGYDCTIIDTDISAFCSIAGRVTIGGARHPMEYVSTSPVFLSHRDSVKTKFSRHQYTWRVRTRVGNDVWIGDGAYIKGGVCIGDGAVIGMGSVITKDVPPYAIVAGNPGRVLRMRFSEEIVEGLMALRWWDLSDDRLTELAQEFQEPEAMLRRRGFL